MSGERIKKITPVPNPAPGNSVPPVAASPVGSNADSKTAKGHRDDGDIPFSQGGSNMG
ncbi:MAG TPA: hypothetical protein VHC20_02775 [Candidatus Paceibacterota bacterium]|nr:hypothetical protein [Candidatus Paceibacterota bacterium]